MKTKAIKMNNGLFIPHIGAFEDIRKEVIEIEIDVSKEESSQLEYKELRGLAIMERYYEKENRSIKEKNDNVEMSYKNKFKNKTITSIETLIEAIDNGDF